MDKPGGNLENRMTQGEGEEEQLGYLYLQLNGRRQAQGGSWEKVPEECLVSSVTLVGPVWDGEGQQN